MAEQAPKIDPEVSETRELLGAIEAERRARNTSMVYAENIQAGDTSVYSSGDSARSGIQRSTVGERRTRRGDLGVTLETKRPDGGTSKYGQEVGYELRESTPFDEGSDEAKAFMERETQSSAKYDHVSTGGKDFSIRKFGADGEEVYKSRLTGERAKRARSILNKRATRNVLEKLADSA